MAYKIIRYFIAIRDFSVSSLRVLRTLRMFADRFWKLDFFLFFFFVYCLNNYGVNYVPTIFGGKKHKYTLKYGMSTIAIK